MAFPSVVNTNESATSTASTTHTVNLPASLVSGNLILVIMDKGTPAAGAWVFNALAGWTELVDEDVTNGITIWARQSDGTEGATVAFTSTVAIRSAEITYQISGAELLATQAPQLSTVATGSSVNPNATTCTPTGGAKDYLWITLFGQAGEQADDDTLISATPTNYNGTGLAKTCGVAGTNLGGMVASAHRTANAASEDAGAWTSVDNAAWRAYTIAVHPSSSVNDTATPGTINAAVAFAASAVDVTVTPVTIQVSATAQNPTAGVGSGDATATPATIDVTAVTQAPTLSAGATVTAARIDVTAVPQAPTLSAGATVTVTQIDVTAFAQDPAATGGGSATATPATIDVTATPQAAALSAGSDITVTSIDVVATPQTATVTGAGTAAPLTIDVVAAPQTAALSAGATVTPAAIDVTAFAQNPAASGGGSATATPATIDVTATSQAPTLSAGWTVTTIAFTVTAAAQDPTAAAGSDATATPAVINTTIVPQGATATGGSDATATPAAIDVVLELPSGTVSSGSAIAVAVIAVLLTVLDPTAAGLSSAPSVSRMWRVRADDRTLAPVHDRTIRLSADTRRTIGAS